MQTSIQAEGFRSLREAEPVEYELEAGEDGRAKAIKVTGPNGAPPLVRLSPQSHVRPSPALRRQASITVMARSDKLVGRTSPNPMCLEALWLRVQP